MLQPLFSCVMLATICFSPPLKAASSETTAIEIFIRDDVYEDYQKFVAGRDVLTITEFHSPFMRRDVADMVLLQQALALGGFQRNFVYLPGKVNFRNTKMLQNGELLLSFDTYWLSDAKALADKVLISQPVIKKGQYLAGIYTSPNNQKVLRLKELADLRELTAVSTPKWRTDWQTMSALPLKKLVREDEWLSQARMVHMQWVDFMLMPFVNSKDGLYQLEQIQLKQVPKVAVLLDDSRHFVVSKHHPAGAEAYAALQLGLAELEKNGRIQQLYRQAGFLVEPGRYKVLNQQADNSH
ncbi:hypothetical protein [Rheinheimera sp. 4Y26]|uniref:hypothetical protein n=1 Tax=Rheinheimera sp. 4Y26 TaxID=2977811 RepID=UPI0021B0B623|nr:hypothetical protein [Rheinheimera sp. 4Y26]MCT6699014.1 hypothetical protein [Rheinheimera sp. 4Y26]